MARQLLRLCRQASTNQEVAVLPDFLLPAFAADLAAAQPMSGPQLRLPCLRRFSSAARQCNGHEANSRMSHEGPLGDVYPTNGRLGLSDFRNRFRSSEATESRVQDSQQNTPLARTTSSARAAVDPRIMQAGHALEALAQDRHWTEYGHQPEELRDGSAGGTGVSQVEQISAGMTTIFNSLLESSKPQGLDVETLQHLWQPLKVILGKANADIARLLAGIAELAARDSPHSHEIVSAMCKMSVWRSYLIGRRQKAMLVVAPKDLSDFLERYEKIWKHQMINEVPRHAFASLRSWAEVIKVAQPHALGVRIPDWVYTLRKFVNQQVHHRVEMPESQVYLIAEPALAFLASPLLQHLQTSKSRPEQRDFVMSNCDSAAERFWLYLTKACPARAVQVARQQLGVAHAARLPMLAHAILHTMSDNRRVPPEIMRRQSARLASLSVSCNRPKIMQDLIAESPQLAANVQLLQACVTKLTSQTRSDRFGQTVHAGDAAQNDLARQLSQLLSDFSAEQVVLDPYLIASLLHAVCRIPLENESRSHMLSHTRSLAQLALSHLTIQQNSMTPRRARWERSIMEAALAYSHMDVRQTAQSTRSSITGASSAFFARSPDRPLDRGRSGSWADWKAELAYLTSQVRATLQLGELSHLPQIHRQVLDALCSPPPHVEVGVVDAHLQHIVLSQALGLYTACMIRIISACLQLGFYSILLQILQVSVSLVGRLGLDYRSVRRVIFYATTRSVEAAMTPPVGPQPVAVLTVRDFIRTLRISAEWSASRGDQLGSYALDSGRAPAIVEAIEPATKDLLLVRKIAGAVGQLCVAQGTMSSVPRKSEWTQILEAGLSAARALNVREVGSAFKTACLESAQKHLEGQREAHLELWWVEFENDVIEQCRDPHSEVRQSRISRPVCDTSQSLQKLCR